jgi:hypothetical protein
MVNNSDLSMRDRTRPLAVIVSLYVAIVLGTIAALAVLSVTAPHQVSSDAWGHAVIVAVFAVVLPLRLRAARSGSLGALRAVGIIAAVLLLVNVIEASIPRLFPPWMRVEMIGIAVIMAAAIALVVRDWQGGGQRRSAN